MNRFVLQLNSEGCKELPFVETASQTYFDYLNGSSGYIVFIVGAALLIIAMVSRKTLGQIPGWMAGILIAALALGSLPALLPAFGINLGCDGTPTESGQTNQPAEPPVATTPLADG